MDLQPAEQFNKEKPSELGQFMKPREVAELLKVHQSTVYQWMESGELQTVHIWKTKRIRRQDLERFIQEHLEGNGG